MTTPPPQGPNPYSPQGPNPYPQQGGFPPPQQGAYPPPQGGYAAQPGGFPPPVPKTGNNKRVLRLVISLVVIAVVGGLAFYFSKSDPEQAKDGDCIKQTGANSVKIVDCTSSEAQYKVVKRVEGHFDEQGANDKCGAVAPTATTFYAQTGSTEFLLCMKDNK